MPTSRPIALAADADVLTPDDIMAGRMPRGRDVLIYDDDHYYMGGVLAELLRKHGLCRDAGDTRAAGLHLHQGNAGAETIQSTAA